MTLSSDFVLLWSTIFIALLVHHHIMTEYETFEDLIASTVDDFHEGYFATTTAAAKHYGIKVHTVQWHLQGIGSLFDWSATNKALNPSQEQALLEYIKHLDGIDMSPTPEMLRSSTNHILHNTDHCVGPDWTKHFITQHRLHQHKQQPLAADWKNSHDIHGLQSHFEHFIAAAHNIGLQHSNLYNMNETGFQISCNKAHIVITMKHSRKLILTDAANQEYVTSIECISADEYALPSFLIVASIWILDKWCLENKLSDQTVVTGSHRSSDRVRRWQWLAREIRLGWWKITHLFSMATRLLSLKHLNQQPTHFLHYSSR